MATDEQLEEELRPKPRRRSATQKPVEEVREELGDQYVSPTRASVMEEPPPISAASDEYLAVLEAGVEIFADDMPPGELERIQGEVAEVRQGRGRLAGPEPVTLHEKLVAVMREIDHVEKRGRNDTQNYDYQRAVDVTNAIRPTFLRYGILLVTDITDTELTVLDRGGGKAPSILARVTGKFTISDGNEFLVFGGTGVGIDVGDKGVYKAITGMLKYGLRTALMLADEQGDPEIPRPDEVPEYPDNPGWAPASQEGQSIVIQPAAVQGVQQGGRQDNSTSAQFSSFRQFANELGMDPDAVVMYVESTLGKGPAFPPDAGIPAKVAALTEFFKTLTHAEAGQLVQGLYEALQQRGSSGPGGP